TAFAAARLPRREAEAGTAASLDEVVTVFIALERAGLAVPRTGSLVTAATDRRGLADRFPHGLAALERSATASGREHGPAVEPAKVTRRQASLLWSYIEGGRVSASGSAAAAILP
ncbi:MAG: hypothetical protein ABIP29_02925, partial [Candidatus Eisenbacteria bacterium]